MDSTRLIALIFAITTLGLPAAQPVVAAPPPFTQLDAFTLAHPDLYWRRQGSSDYERGRYQEAMTKFLRAARYADKPSQAMIAQMLWNGDGVPVDRVMGYVWADLAAERGYPAFIATRERLWHELDAQEQRDAAVAGQAIFDEYADQAAKRREEAALRLSRSKITGSRTGHVGTLIVRQYVHETGNMERTDGSLYYADKYWKPEPYWQWQDSLFEKLPEGKVEVGPLQIPAEH